MKLLESEWFYRMVENLGKSPQEKLLAVFSVTGQWIAAPGIKEKLQAEFFPHTSFQLRTYLINTAVAARAGDPAMLATQLLILLQGAITEELRDPEINAMESAEKAARAVILKACRSGRRKLVPLWSALGSVALVLIATLTWYSGPSGRGFQPEMSTRSTMHAAFRDPATSGHFMGVNPGDMAAVLNLQEQFDRGVCPAPQLMTLPPGQMTAYMNVVHFRSPENPEADRENLRAFLVWFNQARATECYYAPSNGHTLVTWR